MNTQELRNKIDSILGNSMRVLLPSYWWKKLFGMTIDTIESLPDKKYIDDAVRNVKVVTDWEMSDTSTNAVQNKVVKEYVDGMKPSNRTLYYFDADNDTLLQHNKKVVQGVWSDIFWGRQVEPLYLGLPTESGETYVIVSPEYTIVEIGSSVMIGFMSVIDHTGTFNYTAVSSGRMLKTEPPAADSTLTFVAAFDNLLNDTTTDAEKATNKANANTYYQGIQNGKEYKIDFKFFFRDTTRQYDCDVHPSFIGMSGLYSTEYAMTYGEKTMVFAKLDMGDRYAGMTYDLILSPDSGYEIVSHADSCEINLLYVIIKSDTVTTEDLSQYALKHNQAIFRHAYSYSQHTPLVVYDANKCQLLPAGVYRSSGALLVSAGDYEFKLNSDGTVEHQSVLRKEAATKAYVDDAVKTYELNLVNLNTFDKIEAAIAALNLPDSVDITRQLKITDNYANHLIVKSDLYPLANISESVITFNCMQGLRIIAKKEDQSVNRMMCSDAIIHIGTTDGNYNKNNTAIFPSTVKDPTEAFADFSIHYHTKDNTLIKCKPLNVLRGYETSEEEPTYYQFDVIVNGCRETWRVNSDGSCICEKVANMDIDTALSDSSSNPVQNKVIKAYVDEVTSNVAITIVQDIVDSELVTAAALNDLNDRIKKLEEQLSSAGL